MIVSTWNKSFNEVATSCGLNVEDVLDMDDGTVIGDTCWIRNGDKISVCVGNAIWTVTAEDLRRGETHNAQGQGREPRSGEASPAPQSSASCDAEET